MAKKGTITPPGILTYPRLFKPDMKFKKEHGELKTGLILDKAEAQPIIDAIEGAIKETATRIKAERSKAGKTGKIKEADRPYTVLEDGPHAGKVEFRFKKSGGGVDRETKEKYVSSVPVFDAFGKPFKPGFLLGSGTTGQVSFDLSAYPKPGADMPPIGVGVSLRLIAVKIIEAKAYESDATSFGFDVEDAPEEGNDDGEEDEDPTPAAADASAPAAAKAQF